MSVYTINRAHILCSSFAFYDFEPLVGNRVKRWSNYCASVTEEINHPFDEGSCTPGNTKYVLFRNCKRALEKNIDKIKTVELRTSAKADIGSYGEIFAVLENNDKTNFIGIHHDFISQNYFFEVGVKLCEIIKPKYGIFIKCHLFILHISTCQDQWD